MDPDDDPFTIAYRARRQARADLTELLGPGLNTDGVIGMLMDYGPAKTLEQLATAPEKICCYGVAIHDEEHRKRVEASLINYVEKSKEFDRVAASHKPREPEYLERGLGEGPRPSRKRSRGRSR